MRNREELKEMNKSWIASQPARNDVLKLPRPTGNKGNHRGVADVCDPVCLSEGWGEGAVIIPYFTNNDPSSKSKISVLPQGEDKRYAFTLAEVLITLGIIGVVAAITLPALITNIQDRIKEKRVQNIQQKFSKATDKMLSVSGLNGYESTLDFVNELKNHLSIAKICENDELRNCWPTEKVTLANGSEWEISKTKKAKNLKMEDVEGSSQWDDTIGLITGDGTSMILSYNTKCDIEPTATSSWTSDKSSSTNCVAAVFDWNGSSKPNQFGTPRADVLTLNAIGLGSACAFETSEGKCLQPARSIGANDYLTKAQCEEIADLGYGNNKSDCGGYGYEKDYWAWAVKECGGVTKMASMEDLAEIASKIYGTTITAYQDLSSSAGKTYNSTIASSLGLNLPSPSFWVWSGGESYSGHAYSRLFLSSDSSFHSYDRGFGSSGLFMCKGD